MIGDGRPRHRIPRALPHLPVLREGQPRPRPPGPQGPRRRPRLAATLGYLAGSHRVRRRGLEEMAEDVFDVPLALGTVANLEGQMSAALAPAHAEALP